MKTTVLTPEIIFKRELSDFILTQMLLGRLDTKEQVFNMMYLVKDKLNISLPETRAFINEALGYKPNK